MTDEPVDIHALAAEIEAEVRARRAAGEYPPGFERELDALFARYAPPEVSADFDAALERAEDLVLLDPIIPVASRNPAFGSVKRVVAKLIGWYHAWLSQQITAIAVAINNAVRLLGKRVVELEDITGHDARARSLGLKVPAIRDDAPWSSAVRDALSGCTGRVVVLECGSGDLVVALADAGVHVYGVEPRAALADAALGRGMEVRVDDGLAHLEAVADGALAGVVLRGLVERASLGTLALVLDAVAQRLEPGGRLVVCSLTKDAWGRGETAAESDLVPGQPLHPDTWKVLLAEDGFADVRVVPAGADAYVVSATRPRS
jgi:SAM-dependent methyltransferase